MRKAHSSFDKLAEEQLILGGMWEHSVYVIA